MPNVILPIDGYGAREHGPSVLNLVQAHRAVTRPENSVTNLTLFVSFPLPCQTLRASAVRTEICFARDSVLI